MNELTLTTYMYNIAHSDTCMTATSRCRCILNSRRRRGPTDTLHTGLRPHTTTLLLAPCPAMRPMLPIPTARPRAIWAAPRHMPVAEVCGLCERYYGCCVRSSATSCELHRWECGPGEETREDKRMRTEAYERQRGEMVNVCTPCVQYQLFTLRQPHCRAQFINRRARE